MKARKRKLTDDEILPLYLVELKTMAEIAELAGVSKQAIRNVLVANGVEYRGGTVLRKCVYCGSEFNAVRKVIKAGRARYCSNACFHSDRSMHSDISISSRLGRAALAGIGVKLQPGQVVHHIDGDRANNSPDNLRVFDNQREHMRYHHLLRNGLIIQHVVPK